MEKGCTPGTIAVSMLASFSRALCGGGARSDGEMTWPSGETFTGQFRKGIFHGKGTRVWPNGDWYAGEFKNGEQEGEGTFESAAEGWVYNGRWLHGRMQQQ